METTWRTDNKESRRQLHKRHVRLKLMLRRGSTVSATLPFCPKRTKSKLNADRPHPRNYVYEYENENLFIQGLFKITNISGNAVEPDNLHFLHNYLHKSTDYRHTSLDMESSDKHMSFS